MRKINAYRIIMVGKPLGQRPLGKSKRRWKDNIKMDVTYTYCDNRSSIQLLQNCDLWRAAVFVD
jgi:hypothetical protein